MNAVDACIVFDLGFCGWQDDAADFFQFVVCDKL